MSGARVTQKQYVLYFLLEAAAMAFVMWDGLPIYRHLTRLEQVVTPTDYAILFGAVTVIQVSYWRALRHDLPFAMPKRPFLAHVFLFVSRLSFIFASSLFGFVVYRYSDRLTLGPTRLVLFMAVLFSVFCVSRHLEKIGNTLLTGKAGPAG